MRLLVTGGSGFLGGHVLAEAARQGYQCVALVRGKAAADTVAALGAVPLPGDLDDSASIRAAFASAGCEALVNLASLGFGHAPAIVAAAAAAGLDRAVFVSTTAVTTALPTRSTAVRLAAEDLVRSAVPEWTILRPTMIYGTGGDRNLSRLLTLLARLRRVPLLPVPGGGTALQQPVHVADVASAVLATVRRPAAVGRGYDVAGPAPLTFGELLKAAADAVGSRVKFVPVPLRPAVVATRCYEAVASQPRLRVEQWLRLAEDKAFAIDDAARDLDYAPRSFSTGIQAEAASLGLAPKAVTREKEACLASR
jgi:nucleoside-diphosphate-sugar epimerase